MKQVRIAIIGCGRIATKHLEAINNVPESKLVAICDLNEERARPLSEQYRVPYYKNYHTMMLQDDIDLVTLLTPSGMHVCHALDIMERYRRSLIIEKPLALSMKSLAALHDKAKSLQLKIFPVYQNRYNKAVQKVRNSTLNNDLGKLTLGSVKLCWCRPQRYYEQAPWRGTWSHDGGALTNQGIHFVDLLIYLMGDVDSVTAFKATQLVKVEVEDTLVAAIRFKNGALGTIEITTAARPHDQEAIISILGEKGNAIIGGIASNILRAWSLAPQSCIEHSEEFPDAYGFGHTPFYRDVIRDLLEKKPHPISLQEGSRSVQLLNAIYASTEQNRPVCFDEGVSSQFFGQENAKIDSLYLSEPTV